MSWFSCPDASNEEGLPGVSHIAFVGPKSFVFSILQIHDTQMQTAIAENKPVSRTNEKIGAQKTVSLSLNQNDYYSLRFID